MADSKSESPYKVKLAANDSWKHDFRKVALKAESLEAALSELDIDEIEYNHARETDPDFAHIAALYDQAIDLRIIDRTRRKALEGDIKYLTLYLTKIRGPATVAPYLQDTPALAGRPSTARTTAAAKQPGKTNQPYHEPKPMKPEVAAAMIAAGLAAMGELPEDSPVPEPLKNPPRIKPSDYALLELEPASPQFVPVSASPSQAQPAASTNLPTTPAASPRRSNRRRGIPKTRPASSPQPAPAITRNPPQDPHHLRSTPHPWGCENPPSRYNNNG